MDSRGLFGAPMACATARAEGERMPTSLARAVALMAPVKALPGETVEVDFASLPEVGNPK